MDDQFTINANKALYMADYFHTDEAVLERLFAIIYHTAKDGGYEHDYGHINGKLVSSWIIEQLESQGFEVEYEPAGDLSYKKRIYKIRWGSKPDKI